MSDPLRLPYSQIVLASNNKGKLKELGNMLLEFGSEIIPQGQLGVEDAIEDGLSFVENAIIKARHACAETGLPAISDDSGIEVDALKGKPGIYSARYAGVHGDDKLNNALLLKNMQDIPEAERTARFQCVLVFMRHAEDPTPLVCQGSWEGVIAFEEQGEHGFGYDPLFWLPEQNCCSAELPPAIKNVQSHRGKAVKLLRNALQTRFGQSG